MGSEAIWRDIAMYPPPEGVEVDTIIANPERNHQSLVRQGRLWFFPDRSMYVYYTPTLASRPLDGGESTTTERND